MLKFGSFIALPEAPIILVKSELKKKKRIP